MIDCGCTEVHTGKRIVLTGGPGAGKTAVLALLQQSLCKHLRVLPEAAGILFGGGFPREPAIDARRAAQRAIYHVQRELEEAIAGADVAVALCDRGTVDGAAYWPGPGSLWEAVGTTLDAELARYAAVLHLRTPDLALGYDRSNPLRIETAVEARAIDERIAAAWARHPRRFEIAPASEFLAKAARAVEILHGELPECCRRHVPVPGAPHTSIG
jgi:predicted ATPase